MLQQGAIGVCTMPGSPIKTLADLEGRTVAINAPDNILYLVHALEEIATSPFDDSVYGHQAAAQAVVVAATDADGLEKPVAFVILHPRQSGT